MKRSHCIAAFFTLGILVSTSQASAAVYLSGFGGYGSGDFYGAGFGASAGVERPFSTRRAFVIGLRTAYHAGSSGIDLPVSVSSLQLQGDASQTQVGVEIGAVWMRQPLLIATVGTVGAAIVSFDVANVNLDSEAKFMVGPGLMIGKQVGSSGIVGLEFKYTRVSDFDSSLGVFLTFGGFWGSRR